MYLCVCIALMAHVYTFMLFRPPRFFSSSAFFSHIGNLITGTITQHIEHKTTQHCTLKKRVNQQTKADRSIQAHHRSCLQAHSRRSVHKLALPQIFVKIAMAVGTTEGVVRLHLLALPSSCATAEACFAGVLNLPACFNHLEPKRSTVGCCRPMLRDSWDKEHGSQVMTEYAHNPLQHLVRKSGSLAPGGHGRNGGKKALMNSFMNIVLIRISHKVTGEGADRADGVSPLIVANMTLFFFNYDIIHHRFGLAVHHHRKSSGSLRKGEVDMLNLS